MSEKENFRAYIALIAIYIVWGTTYLAIKIGVKDLPPILFAGLRWFIAGPILLIILRLRGIELPKKTDLIHLAIVGLSLLGIGNVFVVFGEQWVPSGLTALLITTTPFWIVGLESLIPKGARINRIIFLGLLLGLGGVALIFGGDINKLFDSSYLIGILAIMLAELGWSAGTVYSKYKKISVHPLMGASIQMIIAGFVLTILGLILGEAADLHFTTESSFAFMYLIVFGSLAGYGSYIYAVAHLPISLVSTYAYVNPIIALFLGWWILGEEISATIVIAAVIILCGVALVKKGSSKPKLKFNQEN